MPQENLLKPMNAIDPGNEAAIRLGIFISLFIGFALLQLWVPRRRYRLDWKVRWLNNLSLSFVNSILLKLLIPFSGTAFAVLVSEKEWSPVALSELPTAASVIIFLVLFDLTIYFQHRVFHYFNPLWKLHRVHHTDLDYDLTTGTRFHPVSIVISMLVKLLLVLILGAPAIAILTAEILLNATSMFNHSNIHLPAGLDKKLRLLIVTPDMHRIHHSAKSHEHNCNFGFNFSCWDRLFGTYLDKAEEPQETMVIGIDHYGFDKSVRLDKLIIQPFIKT